MTGEAVIREVQQEDFELAADIAVAAWEPIYRGYREALGDNVYNLLHHNWRERKRADILHSCRQEQGTRVLVADVDGKVAGFVTFAVRTESSTGEIVNMAVRPEQHGKGIAGKLLEKAMDEMKAKGALVAIVRTGGDEAHGPARRCYEKAGFNLRMEKVVYLRQL